MQAVYRHPYATSIDLELYKPLKLRASDDFLSDEAIIAIDAFKEDYSKLGFDISYDLSGRFVYIGFEGRGKIEDLAMNIMSFLNICSKLEIYADCSSPYLMTWGDYESGSIYFHTNEDHNNKIIITGISNHGDIVINTIPWRI